LKVLYLVATERRVNRANPTGKVNGWKQILNALTIHYGDRRRRLTRCRTPATFPLQLNQNINHHARLHKQSDRPLPNEAGGAVRCASSATAVV
jgi:hypothetical protein